MEEREAVARSRSLKGDLVGGDGSEERGRLDDDLAALDGLEVALRNALARLSNVRPVVKRHSQRESPLGLVSLDAGICRVERLVHAVERLRRDLQTAQGAGLRNQR
jgi:hypothetical protein